MLSTAQRRAEELGVDNVRFKQIDAEVDRRRRRSMDGVLCRWGFMFLADAELALRETRRVLRPGGRLALAAWTGPRTTRGARAVARAGARAGWSSRRRPACPASSPGRDEGVVPSARRRGLRRARGRGARLHDPLASSRTGGTAQSEMSGARCAASPPAPTPRSPRPGRRVRAAAAEVRRSRTARCASPRAPGWRRGRLD